LASSWAGQRYQEAWTGGMTTERDHGSDPPPTMLRCPITGSNLYPTLVAALRDMRHANGRDPTTGEGVGNRSWIGLSIAMIVLDTLTRADEGVADRWKRLLTAHEVPEEDADLIYALRNSLLHGYGVPKPSRTHGRTVLLTSDPSRYAVDTSKRGQALVSVPVFCGHLVERIVAEAYDQWDVTLLDTDVKL
jgi:hypothetical protein